MPRPPALARGAARSVSARSLLRRSTAYALVVTLLAAGLAGSGGASAATVVSVGQGDVLRGSVLGLDLDSLVSLANATATNSGGATVTTADPLSVTALGAVTIPLNQVNVPLTDLVHLGVLNQYASARPDGSSYAASGAVTDSGAVALTGQNGPQGPSTVDLSQLLPATVTSTLANLKLSLGAVAATAAQAAGTHGAQTGSYGLANVQLDLTSPLLASTITQLKSTVVGLQPVVDAIPSLLTVLGPLVQVSGLPNLSTLVATLGTVTSPDGSTQVDLATGTIRVDLAKLLAPVGLDLAHLPPNTELLPTIVTALTQQLLPSLMATLDGLVTSITNAIYGITVTVLGVPVPLATLQPLLAPVVATVTSPVLALVASLGSTVVTPLADALTQAVSLQANVQSTSAGTFTESALKVTAVPASPLLSVSLASASVGPNNGPVPPPVITTPADGSTTTDRTPAIAGTGVAGDALTVLEAGTTVCTTTVRGDGSWSCVPTAPLALGGHTVTATQRDGSGNVSGPSAPDSFTVVAVAAPTRSPSLAPPGSAGGPAPAPGAAPAGTTPTSAAPAGTKPADRLAYTGFDGAGLFALALLLLAAGAVLQSLRRPRDEP